MADEDLLRDLFKKEEEEVETFMDAIKENVHEDRVHDPRVNGAPDQISYPELVDQHSNFIRIQHGWHHEDYVWHIAPRSERRLWKVSLEKVIYACAQIMSPAIPPEVQVGIFLPNREWDIPEITFKAVGLKSQWNVQKKTVESLVDKLFETLNALV